MANIDSFTFAGDSTREIPERVYERLNAGGILTTVISTTVWRKSYKQRTVDTAQGARNGMNRMFAKNR